MRKITAVKALQGYNLEMAFDDGVTGTVDLSNLAGKGVFALLRVRHALEWVGIGSSVELGWGDQIDLCPDALYLKATGKRPEDVFLALLHEPSRS